ncbi:MAG TPA: phospho-N-acetylmuramoyl-pentapeptide-transferase [Bacillota bacterium]|jgi:phospho-N-acetylmuramoyl-pentapeptide-transferase
MEKLILAPGLAFVVAVAAGPAIIRFLQRLKVGQSIRSDGPRTHLRKAGVPTMGGFIFLLGVVVGTVAFVPLTVPVLLVLFTTLALGAIGLVDDYRKVVLHRPLGLKAREKLLGQMLIAIVLSLGATNLAGLPPTVGVPFTGIVVNLGYFYPVFVTVLLIATANTVNLTDGVDGLAGGAMVITSAAYAVIALALDRVELGLVALAITGACLGYLVYNLHPARVIMGDLGALSLGGALSALAVLSKTELLLVITGGLFVIEGLSDIIQVLYFRTTGKRVFLMAPLHHHFELSGWTENQVTTRFWLLATIFAVVGFLGLRNWG